MSDIVFVAPVSNPAAPTTIYGAGHTMAFDGQEALVRQWQGDGKIAYRGPVPRQIVATPTTTTAQISFTLDQPCIGAGGIYDTVKVNVDGGTGTNVASTPASGVGAFVLNLSGLTTATTYYYRIYSQVTIGTTVSTLTPTYSFTTL